jgi:hypothetical protein
VISTEHLQHSDDRGKGTVPDNVDVVVKDRNSGVDKASKSIRAD